MEQIVFMRHERMKAVRRAIAELENAQSTFYADDDYMLIMDLREITERLKNYRESYLTMDDRISNAKGEE